jgi:exopolysaccharide biosynthesis WecB/TagA/CpsF family protein
MTGPAIMSAPETATAIPTVVVGGVAVARLSRQELGSRMVADCLARRGQKGSAVRVFDMNGQGLSLYATNPTWRAAMDAAEIIHADGQPLVLASRLMTDTAIAERSATTDMIHDCAAIAARSGLRFYLLGAKPDAVGAATARLRALYPGLVVAGHRDGYFAPDEIDAVVADINARAVDVLWIGLGKPREQIFANAIHDRLRCGWIVTAGGCFDFLAGSVARAPGWMQAAGLEWAFRLAQEPRRLFRRYLVTNPHAAWLLLTRTRRAPRA